MGVVRIYNIRKIVMAKDSYSRSITKILQNVCHSMHEIKLYPAGRFMFYLGLINLLYLPVVMP